jgi:rubredoxin
MMPAEEKAHTLTHYRCSYCGFVYDPAEGDPNHGAPPGTAFHAVPNGWRCPHCHTEHSAFAPWPAPPRA